MNVNQLNNVSIRNCFDMNSCALVYVANVLDGFAVWKVLLQAFDSPCK